MLSIFVVANLLGVLAHVPGGIGVFESVVTLLLAPLAARTTGSLCADPVPLFYYVLPFIVALLLFAGMELSPLRQRLRLLQPFLSGARQLLPALISLGAFAAGALLLFSRVTPGVDSRLSWLLQNYASAPAGDVPLDGECQRGSAVAVGSPACIVVMTLHFKLPGFCCWPVWFFAAQGAGLGKRPCCWAPYCSPCGPASLFYRRGSLIHAPFTLGWSLAFGTVLLGMVWLLLFSFRHVDYSHELWWLFFSGRPWLRVGFGRWPVWSVWSW